MTSPIPTSRAGTSKRFWLMCVDECIDFAFFALPSFDVSDFSLSHSACARSLVLVDGREWLRLAKATLAWERLVGELGVRGFENDGDGGERVLADLGELSRSSSRTLPGGSGE
eukprot:6180776-Pleurochrysis_carterae.AAC.1